MARKHSTDTRPASVEKTFFDLSKGYVTELSPLGMPGGTTINESNFEILRNGTRRRRKGLDLEEGGEVLALGATALDFPTARSTPCFYRWAAVANNPDTVFIVTKFGSTLHFWRENDTLSTAKEVDTVDLNAYTTYGDVTDLYQYVANEPITMSSMHGRLFVAGKYMDTIAVSYDAATTNFSVNVVKPLIRDFIGIDDNISIGTQPVTLADSHKYNLSNRGWNSSTMTYYFAGRLADGTSPVGKGKYPAKNQIWWKALVRWAASTGYTQGISDLTQLRSFDSTALEREAFGTVSAPQGHLFLNLYDTTVGVTDGVEEATNEVKAITNITCVGRSTPSALPNGSSVTVLRLKLTLDNDTNTNSNADWLAGQEVTLHDTKIKLKLSGVDSSGNRKKVDVDLSKQTFEIYGPSSGSVDAPTLTSFCILVPYTGATLFSGDSGPGEILSAIITKGSASKGGFYPKPSGFTTPIRSKAVACFAGRVWLAGCDHSELADMVVFSKVGNSTADGIQDYSKMHQESDPSAEYNNLVQSTDGGTIQIPGLHGVQALVPLQTSIVVLANSGIWEISGGDNFFSATSIVVRKLSDAEVMSPLGWALTDTGMIVASPRGLFRIGDNDQSGRININNLTLDSIQTYWQGINNSNLKKTQLVYDNSLYRLYILLNDSTQSPTFKYNSALVYDLEKDSFYKLNFPMATDFFIHGATVINDINSVVDNKKVKFFVFEVNNISGIYLSISDMSRTSFTDFNGTEQIPFIETGYDGVGESNYRAQEAAQSAPDHARHRYSPNVFVFMKRTETGVDELDQVIGQSSLLMEGRWDFTDNYASGKIGNVQQVYRPRSNALTETPFGTVVISKNKVRGRGRSLHLKFTGEAGKDAHLLGYSIEYKPERKA